MFNDTKSNKSDESCTEDDNNDVVTVYENNETDKELHQLSNKALTAIQVDVKDIKMEISQFKNDFQSIKTKELVEIKDSINKIQSRVSNDIGSMRNDLKQFKDDLYYQGRPESKVNTPMISEGVIEGRSYGRDTGHAQIERDNSVMSGFRNFLSTAIHLVNNCFLFHTK